MTRCARCVPVLLAAVLAAAVAVAQAEPSTAPDSLAEFHAQQAAELLFERTAWPYVAPMPPPPPGSGSDSLTEDQVTALFTWASGPNIGLMSDWLVRAVDAGNRTRIAAVLRLCQQDVRTPARLRDARLELLDGLQKAGLLDGAEVRVLSDPGLVPLLVWNDLESGIGDEDTLPLPRQGAPSQVAGLAVWCMLPRSPSIVGEENASALRAIDRRLATLSLGERLDFGDRYLRESVGLNERFFGRHSIDFSHRTARLTAYMKALAAVMQPPVTAAPADR